jgi:hypothetical protein
VDTLFGQAVFSVGDMEYRWEDVVLAAALQGDWARLRDRVREGIACLRRADEETDEALAEEEVEAAANDFRYARDLVSAQETEDWLNRWDLTTEGWMDWVRASLLRQRWSADLADIVSRFSPDEDEVEGQIGTEAVCSGELSRLALVLAGRAAVSARERAGQPEEALSGGEDDSARALGWFPSKLPEEAMPGVSPEDVRARVENLARLELAFRRFRERALTPAAIDREIRAHRMEWTVVECRSASFPDQEEAREAALCVREDGRDLAEVAGAAGGQMRLDRASLDEMEPDVQELLMGAGKGDLIGPVRRGSESVLYQVVDKIPPSEGDPDAVGRAEEAILKSLVDREITDRVKWHWQV